MIINDPMVQQDIRARLGRLSSRLVAFAGINPPIGLRDLDDVPQLYAEQLAGKGEPGTAAPAASRVLHELVGVHEWDEISFWGSALARACAWWIGYPEPGAPRAVAAAVLGCSRQNIHDLVRRGVLKAAGDPDYITAESLRDELRRRYPLEAS